MNEVWYALCAFLLCHPQFNVLSSQSNRFKDSQQLNKKRMPNERSKKFCRKNSGLPFASAFTHDTMIAYDRKRTQKIREYGIV